MIFLKILYVTFYEKTTWINYIQFFLATQYNNNSTIEDDDVHDFQWAKRLDIINPCSFLIKMLHIKSLKRSLMGPHVAYEANAGPKVSVTY